MRILVVDDNKGYRTVMGDLLRDAGYEVFPAENGKQAREFIEQMDFDLIVCDVFMPTMDGILFHSYVREFTDSQSVPFIFVSGYDEENTRGLILDPAIDFFFSKNAPIEAIIEAIEKFKKPG